MVLELGGFIELDTEICPPCTARNPRNGKLAQCIEKDEVIVFELRPRKVLEFLCTNVPSPMVTVTARDIWRNATVQFKILEPAQIVDLVGTRQALGVSCGTLQLVNCSTRYRLHANIEHDILQRETNRTASGTTSDCMEVRFKVIGVGMGVTLAHSLDLRKDRGTQSVRT